MANGKTLLGTVAEEHKDGNRFEGNREVHKSVKTSSESTPDKMNPEVVTAVQEFYNASASHIPDMKAVSK